MHWQAFENVWEALEDTAAEASRMTMRSDLIIALRQRILKWGVTQAEAARRLEVTQPRLNDLLQGRIVIFSLDALVDLAAKVGLVVRLIIDPSQ